MAMEIEKAGINLCAIYRPLNNPFLNVIMESIRKNYICKNQIKKGKSGTRELLNLFKKKFSVALMIDQRVSEGESIKLFNQPAKTTTIPAQLVKKYGCPIVPVYIERDKKFHFKLSFKDFYTAEYRPGEDESINYRAYRRKRTDEGIKPIKPKPKRITQVDVDQKKRDLKVATMNNQIRSLNRESSEEWAKSQEKIKKIEVEGESGGNLVKVILSGNYELKAILIDEKAKAEKQEIINDLIIAAYNNAKDNLKKRSSEELSKLTGGINLPFDFKLPF